MCTNVFQFQELLNDRYQWWNFPNTDSYDLYYYSYRCEIVKLLLRKRIRSNFHEMLKSRFNFNFRYLKDYRIDLIDRLESHPSTIGTRRIFDSKSEKSLFPFLPLCEYRLQFVSRIFGSKHRSLAKLGSIGDEMGKFARRPPRAK